MGAAALRERHLRPSTAHIDREGFARAGHEDRDHLLRRIGPPNLEASAERYGRQIAVAVGDLHPDLTIAVAHVRAVIDQGDIGSGEMGHRSV